MAEGEGNGAPRDGEGDALSGPRYGGPRAHDPAPPEDHHDDPGYVTRTRFLTGVAVASGAVITAAILVPVIGFAVSSSLGEEDFRWIDIGPFSDFPDGEVSSLAVSGPDPQADRRVFLRNKDRTLVAIWNRCAHLGCPVAYSAGSDGYTCPCHGGNYDSQGKVTGGPPPRPLDRFAVKVVRMNGDTGRDVAVSNPSGAASTMGVQPEDRVLIGRPFSLDDDLAPYRLHGPGEPVDGALANLYPF